MDDQFKNLKFDIAEEIEERQARIGSRRRSEGIGLGTAIVAAAVILVTGLWGGKYLDDAITEYRIRSALQEVADYFNAQTAEQQRVERVRQQQIQQRKIAAANARKAAIWESRECRFWWRHDPTNPAVIRKAKTMQSCQGGF
ncbi:hypothetical protein GFL09_09905 [Pseudomonas stutzeri]|uniref:hypothetical protein n=1 Tax=Stutzerimonas stutzeri TaxID=316 RepID=UPI00190C9CB0|nr:hypothetical protein [Stutzerimonas stutzeri]MBK3867997.1 hypothetical protein [Stutzerimonas stutzeri]